MSLINLIKCHFKYIINKTFIIIYIILFIFIFFNLLISSHALDQYSLRWLYRDDLLNEYYFSGLSLFKIIIPLFYIYVLGSSVLDENDSYRLLIIRSKKDKLMYYVTKVISLNCFVLLQIVILYILYIVVGYSFVVSFNINQVIYELYMILFISMFYGFLSIISSTVISNSYGYVMIIIVFIIIEGMFSYNVDDINVLSYIFPSMIQIDNKFTLVQGNSHLIFCVLINYIISNLVYHHKDM